MLRSETGPVTASGWPPRIYYWGLQWWNNALLPPYPRLSNPPDRLFDTMAPLHIVGLRSLPSPQAPPPHGHHLVDVSVSLSLRWWVQRWAVGEERDKQSWFDVVFINFYLLYDLLGKGMEDLCSAGPPPPVPAVRVRQCHFPRRRSNR